MADRQPTKKIIISSPNINKPLGPYSHAVLADNTLYVSGMLGLDHQSKLCGDVKSQTRQALNNLQQVLYDADSSLQAVLKTTVLLTRVEDYDDVNKVYCEYFMSNYPASTVCQVGKLPMKAAVEIDAIAVTGEVIIKHYCPCPSPRECNVPKHTQTPCPDGKTS